MINLDTRTEATNFIFKDWEKAVLNYLEVQTNPSGSRAVWEDVRTVQGHDISRASIIIFLQKMTELGFVCGIEQTGKGGVRDAYSLPFDKEFLDFQIAKAILDQVVRAMTKVQYMRVMRLVLEENNGDLDEGVSVPEMQLSGLENIEE